MPQKLKYLKKRVYFNASVIIAGLNSPNGGSGKLLNLANKKRITGIISEIIVDEVMRHIDKIRVSQRNISILLKTTFTIVPTPSLTLVKKFNSLVTDLGDSHVLASCLETKCDCLITLDKRHLLVLKEKVRQFKIFSPGEFVQSIATRTS